MEAGDAPLPGGLSLELRDDNLVEACGLLESGEVELERKRAELDSVDG
jgi:hypothetical protein